MSASNDSTATLELDRLDQADEKLERAADTMLGRYPVQILGFDRLYVIANDGTLWTLGTCEEWKRVSDLPQPEED